MDLMHDVTSSNSSRGCLDEGFTRSHSGVVRSGCQNEEDVLSDMEQGPMDVHAERVQANAREWKWCRRKPGAWQDCGSSVICVHEKQYGGEEGASIEAKRRT